MNELRAKCGTDCSLCTYKFHCRGCLLQGGKVFWGECDICQCATAKGYPHCGACGDLPCPALTALIENGHNPDRLSNLNKWKNEDA